MEHEFLSGFLIRGDKMPSKIRHGFLISLVVIGLIAISLNTSYSETDNYIYDDLNRLKQIQYGDGTIIDYTYDQYGNRTQEIITENVPPVTTASPPGGIYAPLSVTLTCNDGMGVGCDKIYYSTDGTPPTNLYTSPINISEPTSLKFFGTKREGSDRNIQ